MHRAEFEKIRRDHVDTFAELSTQIQDLQNGKLLEVEDLNDSFRDNERPGRSMDSGKHEQWGRSKDRSASPGR